jgi:excinuclease ABC subunit B
LQRAFNDEHGIVPQTITKHVSNPILEALRGRPEESDDLSIGEMLFLEGGETRRETAGSKQRAIPGLIKKLEKEMKQAAKNLDFERAVELRDQLKVLQERSLKNRKQ